MLGAGAAEGQATAIAVADVPNQTGIEQASEAEGASPAEAAIEEGETIPAKEGPSADSSPLTSASPGSLQTTSQQLRTAGAKQSTGSGAALQTKAVSR